jgi:ABC-2 type transport system permease protein
MSGSDLVLNFFRGWAPRIVVEAASSLSFLTNFDQIIRGVISLSSLFFYLSIIAFFLFANAIIVEQRKAA